MQITKRSMISGTVRTKEIDVTEEQLQQWESGGLIQNVMPHLSPSDREFIMTGSTDEEWDSAFKE
jgi:hypothetical protein